MARHRAAVRGVPYPPQDGMPNSVGEAGEREARHRAPPVGEAGSAGPKLTCADRAPAQWMLVGYAAPKQGDPGKPQLWFICR